MREDSQEEIFRHSNDLTYKAMLETTKSIKMQSRKNTAIFFSLDLKTYNCNFDLITY